MSTMALLVLLGCMGMVGVFVGVSMLLDRHSVSARIIGVVLIVLALLAGVVVVGLETVILTQTP